MSPSTQVALYAGSFDPPTFGHLDLVERASKLFPRVVVAIGVNQARVPLFSVEERRLTFTRVQRFLIAGALVAAQAIALHFNIRRYVTGLDVGSFNLNDGIEWWWGSGIAPMVLWAIGSIAFAGLAFLVAVYEGRKPVETSAPVLTA